MPNLLDAKIASHWGYLVAGSPGLVRFVALCDARSSLTPTEARHLAAILTEAADVAEGKHLEAADVQSR